jgi:hypothetical protein
MRLDGVAGEIADLRPDAADGVRAALRVLHDHLRRVHATCADVDDRTWTAYTTGLDRGLAELATEVVGEPGDAEPAVEDVVYAHAGRLEVDGWALRLDVAGREAPPEGRELVAGAARELEEYHLAVTAGAAPSRTGVERALSELRGAVG